MSPHASSAKTGSPMSGGVPLLPTALFALLIAGVILGVTAGFRFERSRRLAQITQDVAVTYRSVSATIVAPAELFYASIKDDPAVTGLVARANAANPQELEQLHDELLLELSAEYERIRELDFRQLHFHLRDNRSFVRFHRPELFGDDLTEARPTVRAVNTTLLPVWGFEEGRIFNGFRSVFPLFHDGYHVGSVEASMNYRALISRMELSGPVAYEFLVDAAVAGAKVFAEEQDNYQESLLHPAFVRESSFQPPDTASLLGASVGDVNRALRESGVLNEAFEERRAETVMVRVHGASVAVTAFPVLNFSGSPVAFLIGYRPGEEIRQIWLFFLVLGAVLGTLFVLIFVLYFRIVRQHDRAAGLADELQQALRSKDRFFSIVSHDLRGPVGGVSEASKMLTEELSSLADAPPDLVELAKAVSTGAGNAFVLLHDLLDWSRSQREDMPFDPSPQELRETVAHQFQILGPAAEQKEIALHNRVADGATAFADPYMLRTTLRNLVSNAVKFTEPGGTVTISAAQSEREAQITVSDTGVGMTAEQQQRLFDLSTRNSTLGTRMERGTGLGLVLCSEFMRKHGGAMDVTSAPGAGTAFTLRFPASEPAPSPK